MRALALRFLRNILYRDPVFRGLEPAHQSIFGPQFVPRRFNLGIGSWVLPGSVASVLWLVGHVTSDPKPMVCIVALRLI